MAFNALMHPRNIYKDNPPNFKELAIKYAEFKKFCKVDLKGKIMVDFKNPESVRALTRALLLNDFDLDVELPPDSLVPRIPLRLNYILWLEDIITQMPYDGNGKRTIRGIDIGTGASCVYPLLGARTAGWHFLATEKDAGSVEVARRNVERNNLGHLIEVSKVDEETTLCGVVDSVSESVFDFCMCNPPFYDVAGELTFCASAGRPGRPEPHSATVAKLNEVCAEGGEVGFVSRIIDDSVKLGTRVRLYTSMIGKKASLGPLKEKLRDSKVTNVCVTTFCQGKTQRWALAWTFVDGLSLKPKNEAGSKSKRAPLLYEIPPDAVRPYSFDEAKERILSVLKELEVTYVETESNQRSVLSRFTRYAAEAKRNTWSHNRRKRRALERTGKDLAQKAVKLDNVVSEITPNPDSSLTHKNGSTSCCASRNGQSTQNGSKGPGGQLVSISPNSNDTTSTNSFALRFDLVLKLWDTKLVLELQFKEGDDADSLHQILQFIKNRIQ